MIARLRAIPTFVVVLTGMIFVGGYYALVTRFAFAEQARRLLSVHFAVIADQPGEALTIWLDNSRLVLGVTIWMILTAGGLPSRTVKPGDQTRTVPVVALWVGDVLLGLWILVTVLLAGVLLGAYGAVQARAFWPYAPVEVSAWALLIATYIDTRRRRGGMRRVAACLVMVEGLLVIAAVLEVGGLIA
jgi:hypothetical protein